MASQAQGKGKKKSKEVTKVSLDEFRQIDAPHGHSVVSLKSLDWAETMADYDQQATETQQIIVPAAPRAQRGPGVDYESLPNEPPFRVSLFNLPMAAEEKDICERFFHGLDVKRVDINSKSSTTVELGSKEDLYEALCKDGSSIRGKTVNVCLYGQTPQNNYLDRYGGRSGNSSYGDRYGDRSQGGGFGSSRMGDRYGDRAGGSFSRDRDSYSGFSRGASGFGQPRLGYGDRFQDRSNFRDSSRGQYTSGGGEPEEPENWRAAARPPVKAPLSSASSYNNGARQPYVHSRPEPSSYQQHQYQAPPNQHQYSESYQSRYNHPHNQSPNHTPHSQYNDRSGPDSRTMASSSSEERPKLVLHKRTAPVNVDDVSSVSRNEAIFGKAKPSSTPYQKMKEVEEKLSTVHISDRKASPHGSSRGGSQPGSAPRSRQVSERSRD